MNPPIVQPVAHPRLMERLASHPGLTIDASASVTTGHLSWRQGDWQRTLFFDGTPVPDARQGPQMGLVELMDNNPLVCADVASLPTPSATLALIALGPLLRAGLLVEGPTLTFSFSADLEAIADHLELMGWQQGADLVVDPQDLGTVGAAHVLALIPTPEDDSVIDELYDECYARSFFVQRTELETWDTRLVAGQSHAAYRLAITPGDPHSLLRILVMADFDGKMGADQVIHALNVMLGYEESLGLA